MPQEHGSCVIVPTPTSSSSKAATSRQEGTAASTAMFTVIDEASGNTIRQDAKGYVYVSCKHCPLGKGGVQYTIINN